MQKRGRKGVVSSVRCAQRPTCVSAMSGSCARTLCSVGLCPTPCRWGAKIMSGWPSMTSGAE
eukprot:5738035-Alexandrium_andersonii.AAC.1